MKKPFTICMVLCLDLVCLDFARAQTVLQGNVTLGGQATIAATGHSVTLSWSASQNTTSYNIYRGTIHGGPYLKVASGIVNTTYTDVQVTDHQTFYYVTTAVNGVGESGYSNEASAVIP
ncbi:MAG: hypothetical protein WB566_18045 [Terriglobales bacterium]